jgi:hypothetical protein
MTEADAAWPAPRLRRLSSSDAVELLEHSQLGPIYKIHQDEGWYLHQPTRCGKVVSTIVGCGHFDGNPSSTSPPATHRGQHVYPISRFSAFRPGIAAQFTARLGGLVYLGPSNCPGKHSYAHSPHCAP